MAVALSPREMKVLELAAAGHTDKGIAVKLEISPTTVVTYWTRIRGKLGPMSRAELVGKLVHHRAQVEVATLRRELEVHIAEAKSLRKDVAMLGQLIESAPEAMIVVNADGSIRSGNDRAASLLECPKESLAGRHIATFVPGEIQDRHKGLTEQYFKSPMLMTMGHDADGVAVVTLTGRTIRCILTLNLASFGAEKAAVVIMRSVEASVLNGEPIAEPRFS